MRGLYAHGFNKNPFGAFFGATEEVPSETIERCIAGGKGTSLEMFTGHGRNQEIWYFETPSQSLFLSRTFYLKSLNDCTPQLITDHSIYRAIRTDGAFHIFLVNPTDGKILNVETEFALSQTFGLPPGNIEALLDRRRPVRNASGERISGLSTSCQRHGAFHSETIICHVSTPGPARNLLVSYRDIDDTGFSLFDYELDEVRVNVPIDGRLFEMDRTITQPLPKN